MTSRKSRPLRWVVGPDPLLRRLYYKFLRARVQSRYWLQEWSLTWAEYRKIMAGVDITHGRLPEALNLCRVDKSLGWHKANVKLQSRLSLLSQPKRRGLDGRVIQRQRREPQL